MSESTKLDLDSSDLLTKVNKKIAQLVKIIFVLNTKCDDQDYLTKQIVSSYENAFDELIQRANYLIDGYKSIGENFTEYKEETEKAYDKFKKSVEYERVQAAREFAHYQEKVEEKEELLTKEIEKKIESYNHQISTLQNNYIRLRDTLNVVITDKEAQSKAHKQEMVDLILSNTQKCNDLLSSRDELERSYQVSQQKIYSLELRLKELDDEYKDFKTSSNKRYDESRGILEMRIDHLTQKLESLEKLNIALRDKIIAKDNEVFDLNKKMKSLQIELDMEKESGLNKDSLNSSLAQQILEMEEKISKLNDEIINKDTIITNKDQNISNLHEEIRLMKKPVADGEVQCSNLMDEYQEFKKIHSQAMGDYERLILIKQNDINKLKNEIKDLNIQTRDSTRKMRNQMNELELAIKTKDSEIETLCIQLKNTDASTSAQINTEVMQLKLQEYQEQLRKLNIENDQEIDTFKKKIKQTEEEYEKKIREIKREHGDYYNTLKKEYDTVFSKSKLGFEEEKQLWISEKEAWLKEKEKWADEKSNWEIEKSKLEAEIVLLEKSIEQEKNRLKLEFQDLFMKMTEYETDLGQKKYRIIDLENEKTSLAENIGSLKKYVDELKTTLEENYLKHAEDLKKLRFQHIERENESADIIEKLKIEKQNTIDYYENLLTIQKKADEELTISEREKLIKHYEVEIRTIKEKNASEFHVMKITKDRRIQELEDYIEDLKVKNLDKIDEIERKMRNMEENYRDKIKYIQEVHKDDLMNQENIRIQKLKEFEVRMAENLDDLREKLEKEKIAAVKTIEAVKFLEILHLKESHEAKIKSLTDEHQRQMHDLNEKYELDLYKQDSNVKELLKQIDINRTQFDFELGEMKIERDKFRQLCHDLQEHVSRLEKKTDESESLISKLKEENKTILDDALQRITSFEDIYRDKENEMLDRLYEERDSIIRDHLELAQQLREELNLLKRLCDEKIKAANEKYEELNKMFQDRPSRLEDIERIHQLQDENQEMNEELEKALETIKNYKLELTSKDDHMTKFFRPTPPMPRAHTALTERVKSLNFFNVKKARIMNESRSTLLLPNLGRSTSPLQTAPDYITPKKK